MSTVIAIKDGSKVYIGCDSLVSKGWTVDHLPARRAKAFKIEGTNGAVMGGSGFLRDLNILACADDLVPEIYKYKSIEFKDMVNTIVPAIMKKLEDNHRITMKDNIYEMQSCFIFAYKDKVFSIDFEGSVEEPESGFCAVGCGYILAEGAYHSIKNDSSLSAPQKVIKTLMAACDKDANVDYPIIVFNTADDTVIEVKNQKEGLSLMR